MSYHMALAQVGSSAEGKHLGSAELSDPLLSINFAWLSLDVAKPNSFESSQERPEGAWRLNVS